MKIQNFFYIGIILVVVSFFMYTTMHRSQKISRNDLLIIGTSADYPPYAYIDTKTNQVVGFDIDIATEIARRIQKKPIIHNMPFSSLIFDLFAEEIDMIAAGLTPTDRKRKSVFFTQTYLDGDELVAVVKDKSIQVKDVNDLQGKTVLVNTGYTADLFLADKPGIDLIRLKSPAESFMALKSGSADVFVTAKSSVVPFLKKPEHAGQFKIESIDGTSDDYAIAINKKDEQLLRKVNVVIDGMKQDGTLEILKQKWGI